MTNKILRQMKDRVKKNVQGSDFQKKKTKLGKKQQSAASTKTAFQSKVLHMPSQSMIEEKGEIVTSRNLTLKDLLIQLSHYNEVVRKDAVLGIKELITKYPYLVALHLGSILEKILNLITDGDLNVRQALISLFEIMIPQFHLETLSAYFAVIRVYLLAGLTLRMTSLTMVELWIDHFPSLLIPIADQLLPTYNIVLQSVAAPTGVPSAAKQTTTPTGNKTPTGTTTSTGSSTGISAKHGVLANLRKLLRALAAQYHIESGSGTQEVMQFRAGDVTDVSREGVPTIVWGASSRNELVLDQDHPMFLERQAAFFPQTLTTTSSSTPSAPSTPSNSGSSSTSSTASTSTPAENKSEDASTSSTGSDDTMATDSWHFLRAFFNKLFPLLMANWVEIITSPHAVSLQPSTSSQSQNKNAQITHVNKSDLPYLEVMDIILQILNLVLDLLGESGKAGKKKEVDKYLIAYFPLAVSSDSALDINVHLCNTFAHFLESSVHNEQQKPLINAMVQFIVQHFQNPTTVQAQSHKLVGLLPVVRKLLTCVPNATAQQLLQAFTVFDENSHPHSAAKRACVEFLSEILQAHQSRAAVYKPSDKIARTGLLSLPKLLFKLSTQNLPTSQAILKALVLFGKGKSPIYESVQLPLVPFFFSHIKPSTKYPKGAKVFGPFVNLPLSHQQDALDLLYYFPTLAPNMEKALLACSVHDAVDHRIASRALDLALHHFTRSASTSVSASASASAEDAAAFDLEHYVAFLVGLQVGLGSKDESEAKNAKGKGKGKDAGKRKRETDGDEVMEVEKDGTPMNTSIDEAEKEGEDTKEEVKHEMKKESIITEKVREVSEKVSECFRMLGGSEGADTVMRLIHVILEATLTENPTIATKYGLLQIIPAIYNGEKQNTWSNRKQSKLPESLHKLLPATIQNYLLTIAEKGQLENTNLLSSVFGIFELCPDILVEVIKLFCAKINSSDKSQLWNVVETVLSLLGANELERTLQQNNTKKELLNLVSILKEDKFTSENLNTTILSRLRSEIEILYGSNN